MKAIQEEMRHNEDADVGADNTLYHLDYCSSVAASAVVGRDSSAGTVDNDALEEAEEHWHDWHEAPVLGRCGYSCR